MAAIEEGLPPLRPSTAAKQALAVATHRVSADSLRRLSAHFRGAVLVVAGDEDILVNHANGETLARHLNAYILRLKGAGHGANEQYSDDVNRAIYDNILRGEQRSRM